MVTAAVLNFNIKFADFQYLSSLPLFTQFILYLFKTLGIFIVIVIFPPTEENTFYKIRIAATKEIRPDVYLSTKQICRQENLKMGN